MIDRAFWLGKEVIISISAAGLDKAVDMRFLPAAEYGQLSCIVSTALDALQNALTQATHDPTRP